MTFIKLTFSIGSCLVLFFSGCSLFVKFDEPDKKDTLCGNGKLDGDEECDGPSLGDASCEELGFSGGALSCTGECTLDTSGCTDFCENQCEAGESYCEDSGTITTCEPTPEGCTAWATSTCPEERPMCQEGPPPECVQLNTCSDECVLGNQRCNTEHDGIEACVQGSDGCTFWEDTPCPQTTPFCMMVSGFPICSV